MKRDFFLSKDLKCKYKLILNLSLEPRIQIKRIFVLKNIDLEKFINVKKSFYFISLYMCVCVGMTIS